MIRLILSFIFFGLLYYAIYRYAPGTFEVLVSWAAAGFDWLHGVVGQLSGEIDRAVQQPPPGA